MNPNLILWPLVIHALVTLWLYVPMSRTRIRTVKEGKVKGGVYKLNQGEPEESLRFTNAIRNQNEIGLLFYAVVIAIYASDNAGYLLTALAWAFVVAKTAHVWIHTSTNELRRRRPVFMIAYLIVIAMWVVFAVKLTGIV
ncbi:MAG: MAPEG family protein [Pseudomonadota bacterium]|nr:MAPEG family protein [Pseudomonadota bacterium]